MDPTEKVTPNHFTWGYKKNLQFLKQSIPLEYKMINKVQELSNFKQNVTWESDLANSYRLYKPAVRVNTIKYDKVRLGYKLIPNKM